VVADDVWKPFDVVISRCGPIPTLVEWDSDLPDWPLFKAEADATKAILAPNFKMVLVALMLQAPWRLCLANYCCGEYGFGFGHTCGFGQEAWA
jgi:hypothetical protein